MRIPQHLPQSQGAHILQPLLTTVTGSPYTTTSTYHSHREPIYYNLHLPQSQGAHILQPPLTTVTGSPYTTLLTYNSHRETMHYNLCLLCSLCGHLVMKSVYVSLFCCMCLANGVCTCRWNPCQFRLICAAEIFEIHFLMWGGGGDLCMCFD